jgi:hypothetical protein
MINHVRTLLLNPALPGVSSHYVGDEFVPEGYGQLSIPSKFDRVRKIVFGPAADRWMMNYRLAEIMTMLHTTELEEFVLEFDPRVTYWPPTKRGIFDAAFGVTVVPEHSTAGSYATIQEIVQESVSGQLYEEWHVTVGAGSTFTIRRNSKPISTTTGSFTLTGGLSEGILLQGSNLLIRLENPSSGDSYLVKSLKRPQHDLAAVAEQLRTGMGAETQAELFYRTSEPFKTFSNLWFDHDQLAYKFGGLILALAHHLDELRTGVAV